MPGLAAPVHVELDARAIPRVHAGSLDDAFRAQGYLHAQERFFQMDLARRSAAGELAALAGARALPLDERQRPFQFRKRAHALLGSLPAVQRDWLEAYAAGVNAGLADLGARPPEYWLLGAPPEPWKPEDSLLVAYAFYTMLSNNDAFEKPQGVMRATLPASVYALLTPSTSRFDRPLVGATADDPTGGYRAMPIPLPDALRIGPSQGGTPSIVQPPLTGPASNQWVVGPARTASGAALLANDPHLELRLPNPFYRTELYFGDRVARGVGIPGLPGILIGATPRLAWGLTVSYADQSDWVVVETAPGDDSRYVTPDGTEPFGVERERIDVHGAPPASIEIRTTRWGPVLDRDWRGRLLALHAEWLEPDGLDLDMLALVEAPDVRAAEDIVAGWSGPSLNWTFADADGGIGWIVNGPLPRRRGLDGSVPESWADGRRGWDGRLELPRVVDPPDQALYTANNRTLAAPSSDALTRAWMRPLRAKRIADLLGARRDLSDTDFLAMQLDTRAEGYDFVRDVALEVLPASEGDAELARVRARIAEWNGRADADQVGFRLLHVYYRALLERVLAPLLAPARAADPAFVYRWPLADEALRRVIEERPPQLLPAGFHDWRTFLRAVLVDAVHALDADPARPGPEATWGDANRLDVAHLFAGLPLLGRRLRLPSVPLPGSSISLRVAEPGRGAVFRMVVSPAHPESGFLELEGGQSGHFLSRHFADEQADWLRGAPAPFLAGETADAFDLEPTGTTRAR
ncbi:MAG TPA: penicillin acylase family protein [Gammaproteobacteria bacterium]|nr:penicillin acylase family protein [Gammaproteobacteria bacterium]